VHEEAHFRHRPVTHACEYPGYARSGRRVDFIPTQGGGARVNQIPGATHQKRSTLGASAFGDGFQTRSDLARVLADVVQPREL
jgi:hypothetical protein